MTAAEAVVSRRGELAASFARAASPGALVVLCAIVLAAVLSPLISPQNPYNSPMLDIMDSKMPPCTVIADGKTSFSARTRRTRHALGDSLRTANQSRRGVISPCWRWRLACCGSRPPVTRVVGRRSHMRIVDCSMFLRYS